MMNQNNLIEINEKLNDLIFSKCFDEARKLIIDYPNLNLDYTEKNGKTPLLLAVANNNLKFTEFLINKGAHVNYNKTYILPIEQAIEGMSDRLDFKVDEKLDIRMIELLLKYGADMNLIDREGETPSIFLDRCFGYTDVNDFIKDYYEGKL